MPAKYVIHSKPAAGRFRPVGKLGIVDWREDCSSCHNCVKRGCVYGFYRDEADTLRDDVGYLDYIYQCKGCLSCVQNCTKNILTRVMNPEFKRLGDSYYTPEIILSTWFQAETGRIPVSGSGYGGPFSGPGFDSMWTDMSEIVRPTRDGIHGREYISTSVDIGRKLPHLTFHEERLTAASPPLLELPIPILFDVVSQHWRRGPVLAAIVEAASELGTMAVVGSGDREPFWGEAAHGHVLPLLDEERLPSPSGSGAGGKGGASTPHPGPLPKGEGDWKAPLVMVPDSENVMQVQSSLKAQNPSQIVAIRLTATPAAAQRVWNWPGKAPKWSIWCSIRMGGRQLPMYPAHSVCRWTAAHGVCRIAFSPRDMRDVLRDVHTSLVKGGLRDEITLIASGGIAQAEHLAKAIICGARPGGNRHALDCGFGMPAMWRVPA